MTDLITQYPKRDDHTKVMGGIIDTVLSGRGWIAGSYARWILTEHAPEPADMDVIPYTKQDEAMLVSDFKRLGYTVTMETINAFNMEYQGAGVTLPDVDILKRRTGDVRVMYEFPLLNQCFALLNTHMGIAHPEAVTLEAQALLGVQNWTSDGLPINGHIIGKYTLKQRSDLKEYVLRESDRESFEHRYKNISRKIQSGEYTPRWTGYEAH